MKKSTTNQLINTKRLAIRSELTKNFTDKKMIKLIVDDSGLDAAYIDMEGAPIIVWNEIMNQAEKQDRYSELMSVASHHVPNNSNFQAWREEIIPQKAVEEKLQERKYLNVHESTFEVQIGDTWDVLKVALLKKVIENSEYVARVVVDSLNLPMPSTGTGFLLPGGYLLTNRHVIRSKDLLRRTTIEFGYLENTSDVMRFSVDPDFYLFSPTPSEVVFEPVADSLDYALVKLIPNPDHDFNEFGHARLVTYNDYEPQIGQLIFIIHHPKQEQLSVSIENHSIVRKWGHYVYHDADTKKGSSGAPIFDKDWNVIGIHHAGKKDMQVQNDFMEINRGYNIRLIYEDLRRQGFEILAEGLVT